MSRRWPAVGVAVLAWMLAGCGLADGPVAIRTLPEPVTVCNMARIGGTLVADATFGLALENPGYRNGVVWPHGFTARRESGVVLLIGPGGGVVAREGDWVQGAGGSGDDAVVLQCNLRVNPDPGT